MSEKKRKRSISYPINISHSHSSPYPLRTNADPVLPQYLCSQFTTKETATQTKSKKPSHQLPIIPCNPINKILPANPRNPNEPSNGTSNICIEPLFVEPLSPGHEL